MTPDKMLEVALQYAGRGWPVFPLSRSKVPFKGSHGHLDATTDRAVLEAAWQPHPGANIGLATGGLVVLDCDGEEGLKAFLALGKGPRTLVARTPRGGLHFYYAAGETQLRCHNAPRSVKGGPGLDLKGHGGFVLLPPSRNRDGSEYQWLNDVPPAPLPQHIIGYAQALGVRREVPRIEVPTHLAGRAVQDLAGAALAGLGAGWTAHEEARIAGALKAIGNKVGYDQFLRLGFALHGLGWERSDGTNAGFDLWNQWAERFPETYNLAGLEKKWESFGKSGYTGPKVTIGTVFALAQEKGWTGAVEEVMPAETRSAKGPDMSPRSPSPEGGASFSDAGHAVVIDQSGNNSGDAVKETNGVHYALPAELTATPIIFPDVDKAGRPKATCTNARVAIESLGIACRRDVFHERIEVGGQIVQQWAGELSDNVVQMLRYAIHHEFGFDPGPQHAHDAAVQIALLHDYDPIGEFLIEAERQWDGRRRLATWMSDYLGAERTALNAEIGRLCLVAAVRRVRAPGAKFDQITVLEGPEGTRKSSAIETLAGEGNFSDQAILTLDERGQQEAVQGVWLYEIADLAGISKAEVERVKAFASRKVDRARPAYGRNRIDRPRRCVFFATTNSETYLKSQTGNRRFWPVRTGKIRLEELARDRAQLWGEASALERAAPNLFLNESLWGVVGALQDSRRDHDPWDDILAHVKGTLTEDKTEERISTKDLFTLHLANERLTDLASKRLVYTMRRLGWDGPKVLQIGKIIARGYHRAFNGEPDVD